jgi:hypothetical protein
MMKKMWAVVETGCKDCQVLVGVFMMKEDAQAILSTFSDDGCYEVREFDLDWGHWIEARKTLGIY